VSEELVRLEHVDKWYGRVQALEDVSFSIRTNEIVGLLGAIYFHGKKVAIRNTNDAIALGVETIYQDSALVTQLSIARNLFLGREPLRGPAIFNRMDKRLMEDVAARLMGEVGLTKKIPPKTPISSLSGGERQAVAIARAMYFDSELIILDEPTNNLGVAETQGVLRFVRNARDSGHSCIFIAHNIHHVFQVVNRIVVLRRGRVVADDIDPKKTTIEQVEKVITGDLEFIGGEMTPSSGALAAAAAVVGEPPPTQ
jgi:simple sugar transport system ATP-binding protein